MSEPASRGPGGEAARSGRHERATERGPSGPAAKPPGAGDVMEVLKQGAVILVLFGLVIVLPRGGWLILARWLGRHPRGSGRSR